MVYASQAYTNQNCLHEDEFKQDLNKIRAIKKQLSFYRTESSRHNLRLLVNSVLVFYNVFDHHKATKMLELKVNKKDYRIINSVLLSLSLPTINNCIDTKMVLLLREEYKKY